MKKIILIISSSLALITAACSSPETGHVDGVHVCPDDGAGGSGGSEGDGHVACHLIAEVDTPDALATCGEGYTLHVCEYGVAPYDALGCSLVAGRWCCPHMEGP